MDLLRLTQSALTSGEGNRPMTTQPAGRLLPANTDAEYLAYALGPAAAAKAAARSGKSSRTAQRATAPARGDTTATRRPCRATWWGAGSGGVAVIGVPDEKWGETIKALVVKNDDSELTEQELIDYVKSKVARYKAPSSVEFREELARTATGKLQKFKLRQKYWEGRERQVN